MKDKSKPCTFVAIGEPVLRILLSEIMRSSRNREVIHCANWQELLEKMNEWQGSAAVEVFTDYMLPGITPKGMVEALQARGAKITEYSILRVRR